MQESIINLILQARDNYTDLSNYSTTLACCMYMNRVVLDFYYWKKNVYNESKRYEKVVFYTLLIYIKNGRHLSTQLKS